MAAATFPGGRDYPAWLDEDDFDGLGDDDEAGLPVLGFGRGEAGQAMVPGVSLHMLAERAVADVRGMADDEIVEVIGAARRLRSRVEWLEMRATAEFARRRWDAEPAKGPERGPDGRLAFKGRVAEFASDEIAFRLTEDRNSAQDDMELSLALSERQPRMDALMASGAVDLHRCRIVGQETSTLSDADARLADQMLAPDAGDLKYEALRRRARKIAMMLDPDSERKRKERATRRHARVEQFPEKAGNHAFAGRELPAEEALACESFVKGMARHLKAHGVPGSLREVEVMVYLDLNQGRDPRDRIPGPGGEATGEPAGPRDVGEDSTGDQDAPGEKAADAGAAEIGASAYGEPDARDSREEEPGQERDDDEDDGSDEDGGRPGGGPWPFSPPGPGKPGGRAPFPAKVNLLVPVGTLLGWSAMPGEAGRLLVDPQTLRDLVQAASHHPATRWCVTVVGDDGTAMAHGCARGRHAWSPEPGQAASRDGPAQLARLLAWLKADLAPIASGGCDHAHREDAYRPSGKLQHLIRARTANCPAPGCGASSEHSDLDHTVAWPRGDTDECNLGPPCRHHHRAKQAPGWELTQPEPGVFRWETPTGHAYYTGPTKYDVA